MNSIINFQIVRTSPIQDTLCVKQLKINMVTQKLQPIRELRTDQDILICVTVDGNSFVVEVFDEIFMKSSTSLLEGSDFFNFLREGFMKKRLVLKERVVTGTQTSYTLGFDKFYSESLINQAYHLLDMADSLEKQELELCFDFGALDNFKLALKIPVSLKNMFMNLMNSWDPYLYQNPIYSLLKSIKRGSIELDLDETPQEFNQYIEFLKQQFSGNEVDRSILLALSGVVIGMNVRIEDIFEAILSLNN